MSVAPLVISPTYLNLQINIMLEGKFIIFMIYVKTLFTHFHFTNDE